MAQHPNGFVGGFPAEADLTSVQTIEIAQSDNGTAWGTARLGADSDGNVWIDLPDEFGASGIKAKYAEADAMALRDALIAIVGAPPAA